MPCNILVTGGAGYIGSHTCRALAAAGYRPIVYDNFVYGHRWAVKWGPLIEGDLADSDLLQRVILEYEIEGVIHFAAYAYVGESMTQPGKYFTNNVNNSIYLLEAARSASVHYIVFSSTCATYGVPQAVPITEDHPQSPVNPYGESKLFIERALRWHERAHGLRWATLRYFNAAGANTDGEIGEDHTPETHLIPLVIQAALGKRPYVEIYGTDYPTPDGTAIRDYVHVSDLASAHIAAVSYLLRGGGSTVLNLGTGSGHSVRDVIVMVERVSGCAVSVRLGPRRAGDPPILVADASRAHQVLNWQPINSDLERIVLTAWRWHEQNHRRASSRSTLDSLSPYQKSRTR